MAVGSGAGNDIDGFLSSFNTVFPYPIRFSSCLNMPRHFGNRVNVCIGPTPAIFVFLGAGAEGQYFSAALQVHAQRRENHGGIRFGPMAHGEMDAIQVDDAVVSQQRTDSPRFILLGQCLVQPTDGARAGSHSQQFFRHFAHLSSYWCR